MKFWIILFIGIIMLLSTVSALSPCGDNTCLDLSGNEKCAFYNEYYVVRYADDFQDCLNPANLRCEWTVYKKDGITAPWFSDGEYIEESPGGNVYYRFEAPIDDIVVRNIVSLPGVQDINFNVQLATDDDLVFDFQNIRLEASRSDSEFKLFLVTEEGVITKTYSGVLPLNEWTNIGLNQDIIDEKLEFSINGVSIDEVDYSSLVVSKQQTREQGNLFANSFSNRLSLGMPTGGIVYFDDYQRTYRAEGYKYSDRSGFFVPSIMNRDSDAGSVTYGQVTCGDRVVQLTKLRENEPLVIPSPEVEPAPVTTTIDDEEVPVYENKRSVFRYYLDSVFNFFRRVIMR